MNYFKTILCVIALFLMPLNIKAQPELADEELQKVVNAYNAGLPLDVTAALCGNRVYELDPSFSIQWESIFLRGYELNNVYRYNCPKPDGIDLNEFKEETISDLKRTVLLDYNFEDIINTLLWNDGSLKYTFLFSDNSSIIINISTEELEDADMDEFVSSIADEEKLDFVYKRYYKNSLPVKISENETLTSVDYDDDFWVEHRQLSWDQFTSLKSKQNTVHDNLLKSFVNEPHIIICLHTELDYKFIFSNSINKDTFEIVITKEEVEDTYASDDE